jgi:L-Lysine epsilon oxidase N-terminal/L-lysine epsilon oxidase C-terminal domain
VPQFKIHPAIGVARLGNSQESYAGPTIPGVLSPPVQYRDSTPQKQLKRQAATFWVYAYDEANPTAEPVKVEVGPGKPVARIEWTVHLANKKAAWFEFRGLTGSKDVLNPPNHGYPPNSLRNPAGPRSQWIIDPGPATASTPGTTVEFRKTPTNGVWPTLTNGNATSIETLGQMSVEADSGLTVLGGFGNSGSVNGSDIVTFANNPGWFDDTSDGSVKAKVVLADGSTFDAAPAWVLVAPPDFAPPVESIVTMYDTMYDVGLRLLGSDPSIFNVASGQFQPGFTPSFEADVYPILRRAFMYRWVYNEDAPNLPNFHATLKNFAALSTPPTPGNDPNRTKRNAIFQKLRAPDQGLNEAFDSGKMPKLHGDLGEGTALTLTATQYEIMKRWRDGTFTRGSGPIPPPPPAAVTAAGLNRAVLEACVGGAFFPGIECGWAVREPQLYVVPFEFRFRHAANENDPTGLLPGDVTKRSALPWQADFNQCANNWWPAQRPNQVRKSASSDYANWDDGVGGDMGMVQQWHELGVVVKDPNADNYFEDERNLPR